MRTECRPPPRQGWYVLFPSRGWLSFPGQPWLSHPAAPGHPLLACSETQSRCSRCCPSHPAQWAETTWSRALDWDGGWEETGKRKRGAESLHHGPLVCTCPLGQKLPVSPCHKDTSPLDCPLSFALGTTLQFRIFPNFVSWQWQPAG